MYNSRRETWIPCISQSQKGKVIIEDRVTIFTCLVEDLKIREKASQDA